MNTVCTIIINIFIKICVYLQVLYSVFTSKFKGGNCYGLAQYQIQQQSLIAFKNQLKLLFPHTLAKNVTFILHVYMCVYPQF